MRRSLKEFISLKTLRQIPYILLIIFQFKNWFSFLLNYIGFKNASDIYIFRNGTKIKTKEGIDSATIMVVFIRKDYGDVEDNAVVIDIGANIGCYSIFAATTSKNTIVYAYEPMPETYDLLLD